VASLAYQLQPTLVIRPWRLRIVTTAFFTILAAAIVALFGLVLADSGLRGGGVARLAMGVLFLVAALALIVAGLAPLHLFFASLRVTSDELIESKLGRSRQFHLVEIADAVLDDPEHDLVLVMRNGYQATVGVLDHCHPSDRQRFLDHLAMAIENRDGLSQDHITSTTPSPGSGS
jgi:hypothetical protein